MYKDKARQREYQRNWVRQKRGSTTKSSTSVTPEVEPCVRPSVTPSVRPAEPLEYGARRPHVWVGATGGRCEYCDVKLPGIATCCNTCARKHDG